MTMTMTMTLCMWHRLSRADVEGLDLEAAALNPQP